MDFSYTEEQLMLQDSVQKFVHKSYSFDARMAIVDSDTGYSEENWQLFAELGWLTVPFKAEDGGFGGSAIDLVIMAEEFGKAMLVEPFLSSVVLCGDLISRLTSPEQKAELLGKLMSGNLQLAFAFAESGSRFNLANVSTAATACEDGVLLTGEKIAVLNGSNADLLLVSAREDGEATDREGISLFLVGQDVDGLEVQPYTTVDGRKAAQIKFDGVRLDNAARLGEPGTVLSTMEESVDRATVAVCAEAVGALEAMLQKTVEYSKTRKQFGTAIGTFQALQHRMANMFIECELAKSIVIRAAMCLDSDEKTDQKACAVSAAKSRVGRSIKKVSQEAIQIHGGIGVTHELDVAHLFKLVSALEILFGNTDFHTTRFIALSDTSQGQ